MTFSRPWFRFRRVRSELLEEGYVRRVRQHFALEFGTRDDVRSQVAELKTEVARLTAELARQKSVAAMAGATAPIPAISQRCRGAAPQPKIASRPASLLPVREPDRPLVRPLADDAREVIVLIADKCWP
jgi:uncharacterized small protein (DUF1192 family)